MIRALAAGLAIALAASGAAGHDFWLDLTPWRLDDPGAIELRTLIGTSAEREDWTVRTERLVALRSHGPGGVRDHLAAARATAPGERGGATIALGEPGTHVVALDTTPAESDLPAQAFDAYVAHEGLGAVAAHRAGLADRTTRGRELYARRAKALVQIGPSPTADATRRVGQSLEIVPLTNPYAEPGNELTVRVFYFGQPLAGALVRRESLSDPATPEIARRTDADGRVTLPHMRRGSWKISTVWSRPIADRRRADYDTLFASLTFGF